MLERAWGTMAAGVALAGLVGCGAGNQPLPDQPPGLPEAEVEHFFEQSYSNDIDILFVIDDSPSMSASRASLLANLPVFMDILKSLPDGLPNVHIGVTSSSVGGGPGCPTGDGGRLVRSSRPGCGGPSEQGYLSAVYDDCDWKTNFEGDLVDAFSCLADLGTAGCGQEQPLEAARRVLVEAASGQVSESAGFLRPDAFLMIVFVTDEDDCSTRPGVDLFAGLARDIAEDTPAASFRCVQAEPGGLVPVQEYVELLKSVKGVPNRVIVSVIGGPRVPYVVEPGSSGPSGPGAHLAPSCTSATGEATPAIRLADTVDAFGNNGSFNSICDRSFAAALERITKRIGCKCGAPCIDGWLLDTDPDRPGLQPDCSVVETMWTASSLRERVLASCDESPAPCWELVVDAQNCWSSSGYRLNVDRGVCRPPRNDVVTIRCVACVDPSDPRCPERPR